MQSFLRLSLLALASVLLLATSACNSTQNSVSSTANSRWLEPSPELRERLKSEANRMPWTHGIQRVELIQWFAEVGEPAYGTLLEMAADPRSDVASAGFAALGATRDSRLVEHLQAIPLPPGSENSDLALERARTLLRLGDWSMVPVLIRGLEDERSMVRGLSSQALFEATRESFGFQPKGTPEERAVAVQRWKQWWESRSKDRFLATPR